MTILEIQDLEVRYGAVRALTGANVRVNAGELVAIIGANGAGKSSMLRAVSGQVNVSAGSVLLESRDLSKIPPFRRSRMGIGHVPEGRRLFGALSVEVNLLLGAYNHSRGDRRKGSVEERTKYVHDLFPVLAERSAQQAGTLSGGEQQMLAIARGLMGRPRVLMLDEPTLGLAPRMVESVIESLLRLTSDGLAIVLVEQNARLAVRVSERCYVLDAGRVTLEGSSAEIAKDPRVIASYLGRGARQKGDEANDHANELTGDRS